MTYYLYNLLLLLLSPALAVVLARRLLRGKSRSGWRERWGHLPPDLSRKIASRLWVHAASVGEVVAATPVMKRFRERLPEWEVVCSVITPGGYETARTGGWADRVFYAPFDVPPAVRRAVHVVQPDLFVVLETELWPNLLRHVRCAGTRIVLINGRLSDRSFPRYRRLRFLFRWALGHFDRILVQSERDAERFRQIGADPARLAVFGNAKFDQAMERLDSAQVEALRRDLKLPEGAPVWVVGSTRLAEEERLVLAAYQKARESLPDLVLIHAPRHVERAAEVADLMRAGGLEPVRRTEMESAAEPVRQLILDTFGELAKVYAVGDVAFLGNSLIAPGGGQSILQPLAQGKPALYGPYMSNFRDIAAQAKASGVGFPVGDSEMLAAHVVSLIEDAVGRAALSERAVALIAANQGAAVRYADTLIELAVSR